MCAAYWILRMFCRPGYPKIDLITVADLLVHVSAQIVTCKPCLTSLFPQKNLSSPNHALSASPGMLLGITWDTGSYAHDGDVAACYGKVTSLSCSRLCLHLVPLSCSIKHASLDASPRQAPSVFIMLMEKEGRKEGEKLAVFLLHRW